MNAALPSAATGHRVISLGQAVPFSSSPAAGSTRRRATTPLTYPPNVTVPACRTATGVSERLCAFGHPSPREWGSRPVPSRFALALTLCRHRGRGRPGQRPLHLTPYGLRAGLTALEARSPIAAAAGAGKNIAVFRYPSARAVVLCNRAIPRRARRCSPGPGSRAGSSGDSGLRTKLTCTSSTTGRRELASVDHWRPTRRESRFVLEVV